MISDTTAGDDVLLAEVPLSRLSSLPPDSIEPELVLRRARAAEQEISRLKRDLIVERSQRKQLEHEAELLAAQSEIFALLSDTKQDSYQTYSKPELYSGGDATAIFVVTDWHCEERIDGHTINGLNEFNLDIASQRIKSCTSRFLSLLDSVRGFSNIKRVAVAVLGDMITGHLHDDQKESNYLSPTEALMFARDHLHSVIDTVRAEADVEAVDVYSCWGNHGRTSPKPRVATGSKQSYEWLLYEWMKKDYESVPNVSWKNTDGYFNLAEIEGKRVRFHHGDSLKYNGGVGGITIPVIKAISKWDESPHLRADLDVFGHWHQFLRHPKFVACNCLIGYNAYAMQVVKAAYSQPSQTFIVIDRDRPGAVDVREIFCD